MDQEILSNFENTAKEIRKNILEMISTYGTGHIGGCLSIADTLAVLYGGVMNIDPQNPKMEERDRFIISKGHGGPAVYSALAYRGFFPREMIYTLNQGGTKLPSHADRLKTPGIDMTAGSLGQGFSAAVGMALGLKLKNNPAKVYVIIGDGESQEGQIWEAGMLAGSKKLDNFIAFTDFNNMQIDGTVEDINSIEPLDKKWESFNFFVQVIDGHNCTEIYNAIMKAKETKGKPSMIILKTIKGKGVSFCEGKVASHSMSVTKEMADEAISAL